MLKTTRFLLVLAALFCASTDLHAQTLLWKNRFPTLEGYKERDNRYWFPEVGEGPRATNKVEKFIGYVGQYAGDGFGGSVWSGNFVTSRFIGYTTNNPANPYYTETVSHYDSTNIMRLVWLSGNGIRIFTNDMQFSGRTSETNSFSSSSYSGYIQANLRFLRCTTNELHFQVSNQYTNFIRRITWANSSFHMKTVPLEKGEETIPDTKSLSDPFGFTSFNWRNYQIKRYTIR